MSGRKRIGGSERASDREKGRGRETERARERQRMRQREMCVMKKLTFQSNAIAELIAVDYSTIAANMPHTRCHRASQCVSATKGCCISFFLSLVLKCVRRPICHIRSLTGTFSDINKLQDGIFSRAFFSHR